LKEEHVPKARKAEIATYIFALTIRMFQEKEEVERLSPRKSFGES